MRLNKWLVAAGAADSRRKADEFLKSDLVKVNGKSAQIGQDISENDIVQVAGEQITLQSVVPELISFNKPIGLLSSHVSQGGDPTVFSKLPEKFHTFKFIGRLDKDSEGLMLFTNSGSLVNELSHPRQVHTKEYHVWLDRKLTLSQQQKLIDSGIQLEDGISRFDSVMTINNDRPGQTYAITMHEGRNRQIRRTFESLGINVLRLIRVKLANYQLGDLAVGEWRTEKII